MKQTILILSLFFIGVIAFAQEITIEVSTLSAPAIGQTIDVPVILTGAGESGTPISACDMNIAFDQAVLTYNGLVNFSPLAASSEWVTNGTGGTVFANWAEPTYTTDVAFPDGTTLFYIRFTYNGGSSSLVYTRNEFYDVNLLLIPTTPINGAVNGAPATKTLNLTSVLPEGLYAGGGLLNQAFNELEPQFPGMADAIIVELHNATSYSTIEHTAVVLLSTTGTANVNDIPAELNNAYYITVKHRNSIEITTADPVSFSGAVISQSFANPANVYGGNLLLMLDGGFAIYGGDVNQDGSIDGGDVTPFDNDQFNYVVGYVTTDINGDAIIDSGDGTIIDNNQLNYISAILP